MAHDGYTDVSRPLSTQQIKNYNEKIKEDTLNCYFVFKRNIINKYLKILHN